MSAGDFDEHIAGVISEDYSKFNKCYDRIKSIMDLNARTDVCCFVFSYNRCSSPSTTANDQPCSDKAARIRQLGSLETMTYQRSKIRSYK